MKRNNNFPEKLPSLFDPELNEKNIDSWIKNATTEEKKEFEVYQKLWEKTWLEPDTTFQPDVDEAWNNFSMKAQLRRRSPIIYPILKIAASVFIALSSLLLIYQYYLAPALSTLKVTAHNKVERINLADGSQVWLNRGSTISYPKTFDQNRREVYLKGEAFFEVSKNKTPFIVKAAETEIRVLGTSFNIKTSSNEVKVQVATGKVQFSPVHISDKIILTSGEEGIYLPKRGKKLFSRPIKNQNYRSWQNNKINFYNEDLHTICETISAYFQIKIDLEPELSDCQFTASFDTPQLEEVLDILAAIGDLDIRKDKSGYSISGPPCKP